MVEVTTIKITPNTYPMKCSEKCVDILFSNKPHDYYAYFIRPPPS